MAKKEIELTQENIFRALSIVNAVCEKYQKTDCEGCPMFDGNGECFIVEYEPYMWEPYMWEADND